MTLQSQVRLPNLTNPPKNLYANKAIALRIGPFRPLICEKSARPLPTELSMEVVDPLLGRKALDIIKSPG